MTPRLFTPTNYWPLVVSLTLMFWLGATLVLDVRERVGHAVIALAIPPERLSMVFAFEDFRAQVHEYQRTQGVSGIIWRTCRFRGGELAVPEVHGQLCAIEGDKERLMAAKEAVLDFWWRYTHGLDYWWVHPHTRPVTVAELTQALAQGNGIIALGARYWTGRFCRGWVVGFS